jgi:hypothetical protein
MFHPSSNRLSGFLEISALSIVLAQSGGAQYKAGFLRIDVVGSKGGGFGRRAAGWKDKRRTKWCAVRESYLVVLEEPGEARNTRCFCDVLTDRAYRLPFGMFSSWTRTSRLRDPLVTSDRASICSIQKLSRH